MDDATYNRVVMYSFVQSDTSLTYRERAGIVGYGDCRAWTDGATAMVAPLVTLFDQLPTFEIILESSHVAFLRSVPELLTQVAIEGFTRS